MSKLKEFDPCLVRRVNEHILTMVCDRMKGLHKHINLPQYQTNYMSRLLYKIQIEWLSEVYTNKVEFWTVRTGILDQVSSDSDWDEDDKMFELTMGMNPNVCYQTQRIIPTVSMENLYID